MNELDKLRAELRYDPATGEFTKPSGEPAGWVQGKGRNVYRYIGRSGRQHVAGRVAWLYVYGEWPAGKIRFLDGNGCNTALANLAEWDKALPLSSLRSDVAAARARTLFAYCGESGRITSLVCRPPYAVGDEVLGTVTLGYRLIGVDGDRVMAHRLAWLIAHGRWPNGVIDHINGDALDNRLANLRDVPQRVNCENQRRARTDNRSGLFGVHLRSDTGKPTSRICVGGKDVYLGTFETELEAHDAYVAAKRALHEGSTL